FAGQRAGDEFSQCFLRRSTDIQQTDDGVAILPVTRRSPKMARLEAVLLVSDGALPLKRLAQLATLADVTEVKTLVNRLNEAYDRCSTPFRIERVAAGYRFFTRPEYALWLGKLHQREADWHLSPP